MRSAAILRRGQGRLFHRPELAKAGISDAGEDKGKYGFRQWGAQITLPSPGAYTVMTRSTNANGVTQPDTPNWNPAGFMRNVVECLVDLVAV